jgi:hypothetical protein
MRTERVVHGIKNPEYLADVMAGYGIRREKSVVASQLPKLTRTRIPLRVTGKQADVYRSLRRAASVEFTFPKGADDSQIQMIIPNALARMTRLEQWLSHPWTFVEGVQGAKLRWLLEWVESNPLPAVIATRFKASAYRIAQELGTQAITGDVPGAEREPIVERWRRGEHQYLIGTIGTIGTGHSFPEAHTLVLYDQVYSLIQMEQVGHRVHRVTTRHPVQVIYVHCEGTSNDLVLARFIEKWSELKMVRQFLKHAQEGTTVDVSFLKEEN